MEPKRASQLILARVALSDGKISPREERFLRRALPDVDLEAALAEAADVQLGDLVAALPAYPDRFVVALKASGMANVDDHLDEREAALLEDLLKALDLTDEDREVIRSAATGAVGLNPRIVEMRHAASIS